MKDSIAHDLFDAFHQASAEFVVSVCRHFFISQLFISLTGNHALNIDRFAETYLYLCQAETPRFARPDAIGSIQRYRHYRKINSVARIAAPFLNSYN